MRCGLADAAAMFVVPVMCAQPFEWQVVEKLGGPRLEVMNPDSEFLSYEWAECRSLCQTPRMPITGLAQCFGLWHLVATAAWCTPLQNSNTRLKLQDSMLHLKHAMLSGRGRPHTPIIGDAA